MRKETDPFLKRKARTAYTKAQFVKAFWRCITKTPNACWIWNAAVVSGGYGTMESGRRHFGEGQAHRISWVMANGPIPDGMFACHKCDNPPCCNPDHLFLGNTKDNALDMVSKGRHYVPPPERIRAWLARKLQPHGEQAGGSKFTNDQVLEIRKEVERGAGFRELGRKYNVCHDTISAIAYRETWKHL